MAFQSRTPCRLRTGRLVAGLVFLLPHALSAQDFWWLRVVQSLSGPLDSAGTTQVAGALPRGAFIGPTPPNSNSISVDAREPAIAGAVRALTPYITAGRSAGVSRVAVPNGPWFLEIALAIRALRSKNGIRDSSDCDGVVQALMDSLITEPSASPTQPVFHAFAVLLRSVACAPAEQQYTRAASLADRFPDGGVSPASTPALRPGEIAYNAFPKTPLAVAYCTLTGSPMPVWVWSNGVVVTLTSGLPYQVDRLVADYSHHYAALLVFIEPPPEVFGADFTGTLFRGAATGPVTSAGECE